MIGRFLILWGVFAFCLPWRGMGQDIRELYNLDFRYEGVEAIHWTLGDFERWKGVNKVDTTECKEGKQVFGSRIGNMPISGASWRSNCISRLRAANCGLSWM